MLNVNFNRRKISHHAVLESWWAPRKVRVQALTEVDDRPSIEPRNIKSGRPRVRRPGWAATDGSTWRDLSVPGGVKDLERVAVYNLRENREVP